jgi:phosphotransferase system enzyme I (PtsI)
MKTIMGTGVFRGLAYGNILYFRHEENRVEKHRISDAEEEILRFRDAIREELDTLDLLYEKARKEVGEKDAQIFQIHRMMLEDDEFIGTVEQQIRTDRVNAEYAVSSAASAAEQALAAMEDDYLKSRAADVREVFGELVRCLSRERADGIRTDGPVILAADDLSPSETLKLDKSKILAFITAKGSSNSHTAILARSMNIPAVVAVGEALGPDCSGKAAIVNGESGKIVLEPEDADLVKYEREKKTQETENQGLQKLRGLENETSDGRKIRIYANAGSLADVRAALENDAGGIGLFRSEFLYLGRDSAPEEEEQFQIYKAALETMQGKEVVIRTLDIGADKQADYLKMPREENPAMGCRAIRLCLTRPEIFKTQLRALYRASVYGKLLIMFPMIASVQELRDAKQLAREVCGELSVQGIPFAPDVKTGVMVETPAAALISAELATEADFFSIGTNDLTQYTLAVDRQNSALGRFYDPHHPAVLRLIEMTVKNAHAHGIWVGICGELGADESLTRAFLEMGLDELSVSSPSVLRLRKKVREI